MSRDDDKNDPRARFTPAPGPDAIPGRKESDPYGVGSRPTQKVHAQGTPTTPPTAESVDAKLDRLISASEQDRKDRVDRDRASSKAMQDLGTKVVKIDAKVDRIDSRVDRELNELRAELHQRRDSAEKKFVRVETHGATAAQVTDLAASFGHMASSVSALESKTSALDVKVDDVSDSVHLVNVKVDAVAAETKTQTSSIATLGAEMVGFRHQLRKILLLPKDPRMVAWFFFAVVVGTIAYLAIHHLVSK